MLPKNYQNEKNSVKLLDRKLIHRNLLHLYTVTMKDPKEKLKKQSYFLLHKKNPRNKPIQGGKRPVL